jgi:hypothetical protein
MKKLYFVPIAVYENADLDQAAIKKENKGISGIYRWTNKENGKT